MAYYEYEGKLCEIVINCNNPIFRFFVDKSLVTEGGNNSYYILCKTYADKQRKNVIKPEVVEVKKENDNYYLELQCEKNLFNGFMLIASAKKIQVLFQMKNKNDNQDNAQDSCQENKKNNNKENNINQEKETYTKDENTSKEIKYEIKVVTICF